MERRAGSALRDQGEHDVAAVAVGEPFVRCELARVSVEHPEESFGRVELVDGGGEDVVGDGAVDLLIEVVADARSVSKQVLDRHLVVDQRQILPQHRTGGRGHLQSPVFDQAHHGQRGQSLGPAGDTELRVDCVRDFVATMGEPVRLGELDVAASVHTHDAGEPRLCSDPIDGCLQAAHPWGV